MRGYSCGVWARDIAPLSRLRKCISSLRITCPPPTPPHRHAYRLGAAGSAGPPAPPSAAAPAAGAFPGSWLGARGAGLARPPCRLPRSFGLGSWPVLLLGVVHLPVVLVIVQCHVSACQRVILVAANHHHVFVWLVVVVVATLQGRARQAAGTASM